MCLTPELKYSKPNTTMGHHVIPVQYGGTDERENVWVLCSRCHEIIETLRRYNPAKKTEF